MNILQFNNGLQFWLQAIKRFLFTKVTPQNLQPIAVMTALWLCLFNASLSLAASQVDQYEQKLTNTATQAENIRVLVMGDSLSAAYGIDTEQGWVQLLSDELPSLEVVNASISGETTSGGKQRLPALIKQHQPQILVLELGANDALRGQNLNVTKRNLQFMISQCQQQDNGCRVILLGIQLPTNYGPAYDAFLKNVYQSLAQKNRVLFDPFFLESVALDPDLMQEDGLHPNARAQPVIMNRLLPLFEKAVQSFE